MLKLSDLIIFSCIWTYIKGAALIILIIYILMKKFSILKCTDYITLVV